MNRRLRLQLVICLLIVFLPAIAPPDADAQRLEISQHLFVFPCTVASERTLMTITLHNAGAVPLPVRGYTVPAATPFIPPTAGNFVLRPDESRTDTIYFAPTIARAAWEVYMVIVAGRETDSVRLVARSSPPPQVIARPERLAFEAAPDMDTVQQCLILENPSCAPLVINSLSLSTAAFRFAAPPQLPDTLAPGGRRVLCIDFLPGPPGPVNGRLVVQSQAMQFQTVPLQGNRVGPGLVLRPARGLDFGDVPPGTISPPQRIGVVNLGGGIGQLPDDWELIGPDSTEFEVIPPLLPATIAPRGGDTLWFTVTFKPASAGQKLAQLRIGPPPARLPLALIQGAGATGGTGAAPYEIDMGPVVAGESRTAADTLVITNTSDAVMNLTAIAMTGPDASQFRLDGPASGALAPGESFRYSITFSPDGTGPRSAAALFHLRSGAIIPVNLLGTGTARTPHRIWIDTATAEVGVRFELGLHVAPALDPAEGITSYAVTLQYDPAALYLHRSTSTDGSDDIIDRGDGTGIVTITHQGAIPPAGGVMARLEFEGLASGRPENPVKLVSVTFNGDASDTRPGNGLVRLVGCDISRGVAFGRPVTARSVHPFPATGDVAIRYIAPSGSLPMLRIVDLTGNAIEGPPLPAGTGEEQETTVRLDGLRPGYYLLELRSGTGRSSLPILIR